MKILIISSALLLSLFIYLTDVNQPKTELEVWCEEFLVKDDDPIEEPLMKIIQETCQ